ncbi:MAG: Crp/Fnr family transcriptional regulator [Deltaproteobacteria bacterium]|nr:Crp/Fnr family transcriptional regulator [Deltaproteobacteria bacterium]
MVSLDELKKIYLLGELTDSMIENLSPIADLHDYQDREVIFREGQEAKNFFMLAQGKVLLEVQASDTILISLGSIKPGYSFGWSALLPGSSYTAYAMCAEHCEVITVPGEKFLGLMEEDHTMGYLIMQGVVRILKKRLERRTEQFLKTLREHPDIKKPFWT